MAKKRKRRKQVKSSPATATRAEPAASPLPQAAAAVAESAVSDPGSQSGLGTQSDPGSLSVSGASVTDPDSLSVSGSVPASASVTAPASLSVSGSVPASASVTESTLDPDSRPAASSEPAAGAQYLAADAPAPHAPRTRRLRPDTITIFARRALPRGGFVKGVILGLALGLPATAGVAYFLSQLGAGGDATAPFARVIAFAAVFAGLPAVLTAGGIGRLAARASATGQRRVGAGIMAAFPPFAVAGAGLVFLTIVPLGSLPASGQDWALTAGAGIVAGAACGVVLGLWVGADHDREQP